MCNIMNRRASKAQGSGLFNERLASGALGAKSCERAINLFPAEVFYAYFGVLPCGDAGWLSCGCLFVVVSKVLVLSLFL